MHKEFRWGGGLRGSWGWGLRSNSGAPFLYVYVLFWGLRCGPLFSELISQKKSITSQLRNSPKINFHLNWEMSTFGGPCFCLPSLASRKRCDLKTRKRCDSIPRPKKSLAIFLRFLRRFSGDFSAISAAKPAI